MLVQQFLVARAINLRVHNPDHRHSFDKRDRLDRRYLPPLQSKDATRDHGDLVFFLFWMIFEKFT